jgi:hypothetical protein
MITVRIVDVIFRPDTHIRLSYYTALAYIPPISGKLTLKDGTSGTIEVVEILEGSLLVILHWKGNPNHYKKSKEAVEKYIKTKRSNWILEAG